MITFLVSLVLAAAPVQSVHTVDDTPGSGADFIQIQDAVLAAADGDTILVAAGTYTSFVVDGKDLAIVGEAPGVVDVRGASSVQNVAGDVLLHNLRLLGENAEGLIARQIAGTLWIQDCTLLSLESSAAGKAGLLVDDVADARLLKCTIIGGKGASEFVAGFAKPGGAGLHARASDLHLFDSSSLGGVGGAGSPFGFNGGAGGPGAILDATTMRASYTSFAGGAGGYADYCECPGGLACLQPGTGGTGLVVSNPPPQPSIALVTVSMVAGVGGPAGKASCPPGFPGFITEGAFPGDIVSQVLPARSFHASSPVRDGGPAEMSIQAQLGDLALVALGLPHAPLVVPGAIGTLYLEPGPGFHVVFAGPWGPSLAHLLVPVPQQVPGFQTERFFLQGAVVAPSGEIQLLGPASVVLVDDAF